MAVKVYTPVKGSSTVAQIPQKIDIPTYPDQGVQYARYSKSLISGNQFKITPQTVLDYNAQFTAVGAELSLLVDLEQLGKNEAQSFYITSVAFSSSMAAAKRINLERSNNGASVVYAYLTAPGTVSNSVTFGVPVQNKERYMRVTFSVACAAGDQLCINLYGWLE